MSSEGATDAGSPADRRVPDSDRAADRGWGSTSTVFLVRHAEAGIRTDRPDDHLRSLSIAGRRQARCVAKALEASGVADVLSSPFVRCVDTVQPLARRLGRSVVHTDVLAEGAAIEPLLRLIEQVPARSVLCTHGDLLSAVAQRLAFADGADSADRFAKGVIWVLERAPERVSLVDVIATRPTCRAVGGASSASSAVSRTPNSDLDAPPRTGIVR